MSTNKSFRAYDRSGNRLYDSTHVNKDINANLGTLVVDIDDRNSQIALAANKHQVVRVKDAGTFTVTIAAPGVFTFASHGFVAGDVVQLSTTGALPTGLTAGTSYYVIAAGLTTNAFQLSATFGGTGITTTGSQSGTHTVTPVSTSIIGLTRYGFRITATSGNHVWVKLGNSTPTIVDLSNGNVRRKLQRNFGAFLFSGSVSSVNIRGISDGELGLNVFVPTAATATITSNGTNVSNGDTVTVGGKVYTFQSVLTNVDGNVKIAATATLTMTNLNNAINNSGGVSGTDYAAATVANTKVTATQSTNVVTVTTITTGDIANASPALAKSAATLTVSTFTGGNDGATLVKRNITVNGIDPRVANNFRELRRQFKHYIEL